ncbi:methyltransferase domain-containing protein [Nocardia brasiliensis]|uniref:methyltransferase domain-containing protein n=1 Tax=Nocardia brasiliensis TaxID=37326 RepID=UPI002453A19D|nr:methyltransferase domain-containing protein [Nocardia brasiliensis]
MKHPSDSDVLGEFLVSARSLTEYRAIFTLTDADLHGRILDCPGGAASFTAEASALGAQVTAADPIYTRAPDALRAFALTETDRGSDWATAHSARYRWDWYGSPQRHRELRHAAARQFGADLVAHPDRYIATELPTLPFPDRSFDLVLSSHLLFTYADRLDAHFHLTALLELARVCAGEVRLYPLVDHLGNHQDDLLAQLRKGLADKGIGTELRATDYEFHHGARTVLVLHP